MRRTVFNGQIHGATVTHADVDDRGSVTIDAQLMAAANIVPHQLVHLWNVTNGERLTTYALAGEAGSGVVCLNGAAAHRARRGHKVIIASFVELDEAAARCHVPRRVFVDDANRIRPRDRGDMLPPGRSIGSVGISATSDSRSS
jgi:aspartate 1-decarboxylase